MATLIAEMAKFEGLSEKEVLLKYMAEQNNNIKNTAKRLGISESAMRQALSRNGIYYPKVTAQTTRKLYGRDYRNVSEHIAEQCEKLRKDNLMLSFKAFHNIISRVIAEERKNANT